MLLYFPSSRYSAFTEMMYMGNKSRTTVGKEDVAIAQSGSEYHASLLFMVVQNSIRCSCSIFPLIVILIFTITTRLLVSVKM